MKINFGNVPLENGSLSKKSSPNPSGYQAIKFGNISESRKLDSSKYPSGNFGNFPLPLNEESSDNSVQLETNLLPRVVRKNVKSLLVQLQHDNEPCQKYGCHWISVCSRIWMVRLTDGVDVNLLLQQLKNDKDVCVVESGKLFF